MPTFLYTARDATGQAVSGALSAPTEADVTHMLRAEGKYPVSIRPAPASTAAQVPGRGGRGIKISRAEVIQISTQIAIMLETGVTLAETLESVASQARKPNLRMLLEDLSQHVQTGEDFSSALSRHPRSFPRLYIALIRASERSGMMVKLLNRATAYLRDEHETVRRVKGALTYPAIMLTFAILTTTFLLAFVLPRFSQIYSAKSAVLPTPTRILMGLSDFLVQHYVLVPSVLVALVIGAWAFFTRTGVGRRAGNYLQLHLPLYGTMYRKMHLARGLRMLGTMAGAGINLVDCVNTTRELSSNVYFQQLWTKVGEQIQAGRQLSEPLFHSDLVPRPVAQMLHSGEKGGKLAQVLEQVSAHAETELKDQIAEMTRYIEPAMIILMGVIIGGVAMALLLPIFNISRVISAG